MTIDEIVSATVFMALNAPCSDHQDVRPIDIGVALVREVADYLEDTNFGQLLRKALQNYGVDEQDETAP